MKRTGRAQPQRLSLHPLAQNSLMAVDARRGTVVACLSGELWITQAGDSRDHIVPRGYRYCSNGRGLIVVNSLSGLSHALVYWSNPEHGADLARNGVHFDHESTQRLMQHAQALRQNAMGHAIRRLRRNLIAAWRLLMNRCFHTGQM